MTAITLKDLDKERDKQKLRERLSKIGRKILIMSGKGGVGKSTVAVNLAAALASLGQKTGILDIDLHGPSVAGLLKIEDKIKTDQEGNLIPFEKEHGLLAVTIQGLLADPNQAVIWRGPKKLLAIRQFISETNWGELDFLIIDSPPGTGDESLAIIGAIHDLEVIMVSSGHKLAINDVSKALNFLSMMKAKAIGLVDNQSFLSCPKCQDKIALYDLSAVAQLAGKTNLPLLAQLPLDPQTAQEAEAGRPIVWSQPQNNFSAGIMALAQSIVKNN